MIDPGALSDLRRRALWAVNQAPSADVVALAVQAVMLLEVRERTLSCSAYYDSILSSLAPTFARELERLVDHAATLRAGYPMP